LGVLARSAKAGSGKFRSIDFHFDRSTFQDLRISRHFLMKFAIPLLLTYRNRKIEKLTKTSENNKAKGLTSANQGSKYTIFDTHHIQRVTGMADSSTLASRPSVVAPRLRPHP
jgi:hypothetical protein